jgi:hypothetical protein
MVPATARQRLDLREEVHPLHIYDHLGFIMQSNMQQYSYTRSF